jgi:hypothetical protein
MLNGISFLRSQQVYHDIGVIADYFGKVIKSVEVSYIIEFEFEDGYGIVIDGRHSVGLSFEECREISSLIGRKLIGFEISESNAETAPGRERGQAIILTITSDGGSVKIFGRQESYEDSGHTSPACFNLTNLDPVPQIFDRIITNIEMTEDYILIDLDDHNIYGIFDNEQKCCERRYMMTDDDINSLIGHRLRRVDVKFGPPVKHANGRVSRDTCFLEIGTDGGSITVVSHNLHNGYYDGLSPVMTQINDRDLDISRHQLFVDQGFVQDILEWLACDGSPKPFSELRYLGGNGGYGVAGLYRQLARMIEAGLIVRSTSGYFIPQQTLH